MRDVFRRYAIIVNDDCGVELECPLENTDKTRTIGPLSLGPMLLSD